MAVICFAVMPPMTVVSMIDAAEWETVLYTGSPKTVAGYQQFCEQQKNLSKKAKKKHKRAVQAVIGVHNLKHLDNSGIFHTTLVFDAAPNLMRLRERVKDVEIVDIESKVAGVWTPKPMSPKTFSSLIEKEGSLSKLPAFLRDNSYATPAAIKETTARIEADQGPDYPDVPNGVRALMQEFVAACGKDWVDAADVVYMQYLFHTCNRSYVTSKVTKKLTSKEAKAIWSRMLEYADSDVGYAMYSAFYELCGSDDVDYTPDTAVVDYGLDAYGKDFMYAISVMPVSGSYDFLSDIGDFSREREEQSLLKKPSSTKTKKTAKKPSKK